MKLIIPGTPIAKKRPKFARIGKGVRTYSIQDTDEGRFLLEIRQQLNSAPPLTGPLAIRLTFYVPRPQGHYGTGRNAGRLKDSAPQHPTAKPDLDNLEKFAADCLNGIAWQDDRQIVESLSRKRYCDGGMPRTEIEIVRK